MTGSADTMGHAESSVCDDKILNNSAFNVDIFDNWVRCISCCDIA